MKERLSHWLLGMSAIMLLFTACSKERSSITGWKYNDSKWGGFEVQEYPGQATGPNLVLVEGGTFVMGNTEQDVTYEYNTMPRTVTVSSFYIDETEIANAHYREYVYWTRRTFGADFPEVYRDALPDTNSWREELAYNDPYVQYYFRHPAYNWYPVVGVSWLQAVEFSKWRTDRVNEMYLIEKKVLEPNPSQYNEDNFNTEAYLLGQYEGTARKNGLLKDYNPDGTGERKARMEDGIMLPDYRLPTEAEWEYAALAIRGNHVDPEQEMYSERRIYPWNGSGMRETEHGGWQGDFLANFKRGRGDYAGLAGNLNDNAIVTAPIYSYMPNDYGLFNMAGNVAEWVADVYRPLTYMDMEDLNPFRGNVYEERIVDEEGYPVEKDSMGRIQYEVVKTEDVIHRRNYKRGDVINYIDGDSTSLVAYNYGKTTLVSDNTRVYKGGSWADEAFWLAPGSRKWLEEDQALATLGFRCAMIRLGGDVSNEQKGGNQFTKQSKKVRKQNAKNRKY